MNYGRRLQVLLDENRFERLERAAKRRGVSVAQVVRDAIDALVPDDELDREGAIRMLLDAEPMPVADWDVLKQEIEGRFGS